MVYHRRTLRWADRELRPAILTSRRARRRGLHDPEIQCCLFAARSIHTFGMGVPIGVVWISSDGIVVRRTLVRPNRVTIGPTGLVLESRLIGDLPTVGTRLSVVID